MEPVKFWDMGRKLYFLGVWHLYIVDFDPEFKIWRYKICADVSVDPVDYFYAFRWT